MKYNRFVKNYVTLLLCLFFLVSSCSKSGSEIYKEQLFVFGTIVEINIWGVDRQQAKEASAVLAEDFDYMNRTWHPWQGGSLSRMNSLFPLGVAFSGSPAVLPVIKKAKLLSRQSDYLFNPAIGNIIKLWDFENPDIKQMQPPEPDDIKVLLDKNMTLDNLHIQGVSIRSDVKELAVDLGAIAKGFGVDMAIEQLRNMGINNAIINAGGDLRAIGKPGKRNWKIGIRHPRNKGTIASLEIERDESVFTSGDYERYFEYEGQRYHHILDPRTGYPAQDTISVTVIHADAATADAAATALFIAGPDDWHRIARAMGLTQVMLIDKNMRIQMTPAMAERIEIDDIQQYDIVISEPLH